MDKDINFGNTYKPTYTTSREKSSQARSTSIKNQQSAIKGNQTLGGLKEVCKKTNERNINLFQQNLDESVHTVIIPDAKKLKTVIAPQGTIVSTPRNGAKGKVTISHRQNENSEEIGTSTARDHVYYPAYNDKGNIANNIRLNGQGKFPGSNKPINCNSIAVQEILIQRSYD